MDTTDVFRNMSYHIPQAPSLPQYPEMILAAIEALNDPNGSNKTAITKLIESTYGDLPAAHSTLLSHHLEKMKQSGELIMVKNNYMKPDPNTQQQKRGRGRPPKERDPSATPVETSVGSPKRGRGRPPKARDPSDPPAPYVKKVSSGSGKPRGRPPKKAKTENSAPLATIVVPVNGTPRGRGRPPKAKSAEESVET